MVTKERINGGWTQIQIKKDTAMSLKKHGWYGANYDDIVVMLLEKAERMKNMKLIEELRKLAHKKFANHEPFDRVVCEDCKLHKEVDFLNNKHERIPYKFHILCDADYEENREEAPNLAIFIHPKKAQMDELESEYKRGGSKWQNIKLEQ